MTVLRVLTAPHRVLQTKTKRVGIHDGSIQRLIDDLIETMHAYEGVGLAANQVGALQRVFVIQLPEDEEAQVFINPEITRREGQREVEEGCLSVPGYRGLVHRSERVRVKGLDRHGRPVRVKAEELLAQALEHELDHLNGILYIGHLVSKESLWKLEPEETRPEVEAATPPQG
ncbi:MAG: peptide deformylase [Dehalococcoidia bacterium]